MGSLFYFCFFYLLEGFGAFCVGREFFFMGFRVILGLGVSFFDF